MSLPRNGSMALREGAEFNMEWKVSVPSQSLQQYCISYTVTVGIMVGSKHNRA